jgi:hypothetical protein
MDASFISCKSKRTAERRRPMSLRIPEDFRPQRGGFSLFAPGVFSILTSRGLSVLCTFPVLCAVTAFCLLAFGTEARGATLKKPPCRWDPAPHYTKTSGRKIRYIIIHTIEGSILSAVRWFKNPKSRVSSHYIVGFGGETVQMVRDEDIAWHAGVRLYNVEGIGIEHEGYAAKNLWTKRQYMASAHIAAWLCRKYGIPVDRRHLLAHSEIAPGRKSDPGPHFDWDGYLKLVRDILRRGGSAEVDLDARPGRKSDRESGGKKLREKAKKILFVARKLHENQEYYKAFRLFRLLYCQYEGLEEAEKAGAYLKTYRDDSGIAAEIRRNQKKEEIRMWLGLAESYAANDKYRKALEFLQKIIHVYPDHPLAKRARERIAAIEKKAEVEWENGE